MTGTSPGAAQTDKVTFRTECTGDSILRWVFPEGFHSHSVAAKGKHAKEPGPGTSIWPRECGVEDGAKGEGTKPRDER